MLRTTSILAGTAISVLLIAAAPVWAESGAAPKQSQATEFAQAGNPSACQDRRQQIQARIEQFRQQCLAQPEAGRAAACEAEQHRITQDVGSYNSHCGG